MKLLLAVVAMLLVSVSWAAGSPAAAQGASIKGSVLEVKDVDAYTYLRLKTADGETWAAVGKAPVKVGADVTIENPMVMNNFESKTLKKTFDKIVFGNLAGAGAAAPSKDLGQIHGGLTKAADVKNVKVAKASGPDARTVGEIVAKRTELKDKPVAVRGTVVKFTGGVMGKNWVHLRDGTGSDKDGTNDLVVTTQDETKVGDVVLVKGVVRTDINLGSGYSYAVLVEDAKLQK
ncbi:MAG TPA: nucleotide-binding protein [Casimicrobiaceae bacterium]|nr:nucleotide-binding protein [Casimicrobiaceae bacterium]